MEVEVWGGSERETADALIQRLKKRFMVPDSVLVHRYVATDPQPIRGRTYTQAFVGEPVGFVDTEADAQVHREKMDAVVEAWRESQEPVPFAVEGEVFARLIRSEGRGDYRATRAGLPNQKGD